MIINGEKWACEACVRGHRVSNCQHHGEFLLLSARRHSPFPLPTPILPCVTVPASRFCAPGFCPVMRPPSTCLAPAGCSREAPEYIAIGAASAKGVLPPWSMPLSMHLFCPDATLSRPQTEQAC